jgi:hypothetical protein
MIKKGILATSMLLLVTGCATSGSHSTGSSEKIHFESKAFEMLAEASIEARDELRLLAKTRDSKALGSMTEEQKKQRFQQATVVPEGFNAVVTVKFTGEAIDATKLLSRLSGYDEVLEIGNKPRSPIIVSLNQENKPLINSLRELAMQVGDAATIEVYPNTKQIRVVYGDMDQSASSVYNR